MDAEIDELLDELLGADGRRDIIGYNPVTEPKRGIRVRIDLSSYYPSDFDYPLAMKIARGLAKKYGVALGLYNTNSGTNNQPSIPIFFVTCYDDGGLDKGKLYAGRQKIINAADELEERCRMIAKLEEKMREK